MRSWYVGMTRAFTQDGMRVAVIVNDMAEVNIDAMLVNSSEVMKVEDKMVEMQSFEQKT